MSMPFKKFRFESGLEAEGINLLKKKYGRNIWCVKTSYKRVKDKRAEPDHYFCFFGFFVAVEFKNGETARKKHEALQDYVLMRIREANGFAFKCRTLDDPLSGFGRIHDLILKKS